MITIIFTVTLFDYFKTENGMIIVYSLLLNIYFYSLYFKYNIWAYKILRLIFQSKVNRQRSISDNDKLGITVHEV